MGLGDEVWGADFVHRGLLHSWRVGECVDGMWKGEKELEEGWCSSELVVANA